MLDICSSWVTQHLFSQHSCHNFRLRNLSSCKVLIYEEDSNRKSCWNSPEFNIKKNKTIKHADMLLPFMKKAPGEVDFFFLNVFLFAHNSLLIRAYHSRRVIIDVHVSRWWWINLFHMFHLHVLSIIFLCMLAPVGRKTTRFMIDGSLSLSATNTCHVSSTWAWVRYITLKLFSFCASRPSSQNSLSSAASFSWWHLHIYGSHSTWFRSTIKFH